MRGSLAQVERVLGHEACPGYEEDLTSCSPREEWLTAWHKMTLIYEGESIQAQGTIFTVGQSFIYKVNK